MAALPGVTRAVLSPTAGLLTVEGVADLEAIRRKGRRENYRILLETNEEEPKDDRMRARDLTWGRLRAGLSGLTWAVGYVLQLSHPPVVWALPFYAVAVVSGGWGNAKKAYYAIFRLDLNMSVLMTIAMIGAMAIGKWEEAAMVAFLYAVSELLEAWSIGRARRSIRELMDIAPKRARIRSAGEERDVSVEEVQVGDILVIRPGEKIAMDGRIVKGESAISEAAITGESIPADKGPGADVFAGTLNTNGALEVEVAKRAEDSTLARIIHLVEEAQGSRAPSQAFVDRFAKVYTPVVLGLAMVLAIAPPLIFRVPWEPWIYRGLALLVVSCPCALVVSTPVAIVSAISRAAKRGVLIKGGLYLEQMATIRAIAFDKTGTLTKGSPAVTDLCPLDGTSEAELLRVAVSLEARSEHPLARAIVRAGRDRDMPIASAESVVALPGRGLKGDLDGRIVYIGNVRLFREQGLVTEAILTEVQRRQADGKTVMLAGTSDRVLGSSPWRTRCGRRCPVFSPR